jgi:hypothetical protein
MSVEENEMFTLLAAHADAIDNALQSKEKNFDTRMLYLGHLAMCARIFKIIYRCEDVGDLEKIHRIEQASFRLATPPTSAGSSIKATWCPLSVAVLKYIDTRKAS